MLRIYVPRGDPRLEPRSIEFWYRQIRIRDDSLAELGFSTYDEYLADPEYRKRKQAILDGADGSCGDCGRPSDLDVHHLHYESLGGEAAEDLIALCRECHRVAHYGIPIEQSSYRPRRAQRR